MLNFKDFKRFNIRHNIIRILPDLVISTSLLYFLISKTYELLPQPVALIAYKAVLVSIAFLHAHITRKIAFPKVEWESSSLNASTIVSIVIYVMFIYAYSIGG